jgi:putative iron-dependent peroxidase
MTTPQGGILPDGNSDAAFLTFMLKNGGADQVRAAAAGLAGLTAEVAAQDPSAGLASVIAFGSAAWDQLWPQDKLGPRPDDLAPFQSFADGGRSAPATDADIFLHIRGDRRDLVFELSKRMRAALGDAVETVEEVHGFRYLDSRDLTGFVDGTENPQGTDDRTDVALVADGPFAGGSFVNIQRYIHDLPKWDALETKAQEDIIARTKADNVEYAAADKPPFAHIKRVSIKEDGKSLEMLRHSMPYGTADEYGLLFVAYTGRADTFPRMLEAMIVADDDGNYDHLMDFSRAVTGCTFFAPPADWLAQNT